MALIRRLSDRTCAFHNAMCPLSGVFEVELSDGNNHSFLFCFSLFIFVLILGVLGDAFQKSRAVNRIGARIPAVSPVTRNVS